jgi:DNA-binding CsgD family transcriptional regulator/PAS domain-containing protein
MIRASMEQESLLNQIYGAIADPARWPEVLTSVSDHVDSVGGMLVYNAPPGGKNMIVLARLDPQYNAVFHKHHVWNPWTRAIKEEPFDHAILCGSLVERRVVHKTAFYADVLAPQKIHDMLCVTHQALTVNGSVGGIGFSLSARGVDRAEQNQRRLQRLVPHLCRALDATLRLGPLVDGSRQLARVLQLMPSAALLLDGKGSIVHANPAAELLLRKGDGLTCVDDGGLRLAAVLPDEHAALSHSLARALRVADGSSDALGEPLRLTRLSHAAPLLVIPVPLPPPAFSLWELSDSARLLVLIIDPSARHRGAAPALQTTFGLTSAEARVATLVGSGLSGPQAAQILDVSPATVKTHLARCFEKMGLRSQVELARILSALPVDQTIFNQ